MRSLVSAVCLALVASLSACMERPQEQGKRVVGDAASKGTGSKFVAPDWKPGDETSWDEHMRARAAYGQNEYSRSSSK
jgi:hypothetical protein